MDFSYRLVSPSDPHQGPVQFLARARDQFSPFCGATLVSPQWLVTAAHCAHSNTQAHSYCQDLEVTTAQCHRTHSCPRGCHRLHPKEVSVYIGLSDLTRRGPGLRVTDIVLHPGWNLASMTNDITMGHDLALIRLEVSLSPSEVVWPACLPDPFFVSDPAPVGDDVSVVGFGMTKTQTQVHSDILQKADLKVQVSSSFSSINGCLIQIVDPWLCKSPHNWDVLGDQICAHGSPGLSGGCVADSCSGDSGGERTQNVQVYKKPVLSS